MRKFLLLIAVALFSTATYAQLWNASISAVGANDVVNFNSPAAMDVDGNLYVTGTQTENFEFAGDNAEVLALGAYIAKYNANGEEQFAITLHGAIDITAITTDADKNFYVAGSYAGEAYITDVEGVNGGFEAISNSEEDSKTAAFIAKYDANGNLLAVKSYEAVTNAPMMDLYFGNPASVSVENIAAVGENVYAQLRYNGDVVLSETTTLVSKYVFAWFSFYLDCASTALISYDSNLDNPSAVAELAITEDGGDATSINSFAFAIDGDDVYVAAMGQGDLALTTSTGTETFKFEYDGMGTTERGAILAKVGSKAVKFSNIPNSVSANYERINGIEVRDGKIYLAGTFGVTCAFDNSKVATGASDVFVASIDANELTADWVYTNANDEGATNKFYEEVTGVVFGKEHAYIVDAITDMNNEVAPVAKNYAISYNGIAEEKESVAATAVAYNANNYAIINCVGDTHIAMYAEEAEDVVPVDYTPAYTGTKEKLDRNVIAVTLGNNRYDLTSLEQSSCYVDATAVATFKVEAGATVKATVERRGEWVHHALYIDFDADGFTSGIEDGSEWKPAGDLVSYSFYNNNGSSDEYGYNSVGTYMSGMDRHMPEMPEFVAPATPGIYRMRFVQDWCSIDPNGDSDGKFGDFMANRGQIVDVMLEVVEAITDGIDDINAEVENNVIYDLTGRRIEKITESGIYIVNGKKVLVK